jgi:hypothetical protein
MLVSSRFVQGHCNLIKHGKLVSTIISQESTKSIPQSPWNGWKFKIFNNFAACYLYLKSLRIYVCRLKNVSSRLILIYKNQKYAIFYLRWNSLTAFLVEVSGAGFKTQVFVGFLPSFFCSTECYSWIDSSFLVSQIFL